MSGGSKHISLSTQKKVVAQKKYVSMENKKVSSSSHNKNHGHGSSSSSKAIEKAKKNPSSSISNKHHSCSSSSSKVIIEKTSGAYKSSYKVNDKAHGVTIEYEKSVKYEKIATYHNTNKSNSNNVKVTSIRHL